MRFIFLALFLKILLIPVLADSADNYNESQFFRTEIFLEPDRTHFYVNDPIRVVFRNDFGRPVYVIKSSGLAPLLVLQKWNGENWQRVNTARRGVGGIQVKSYHELNPRESLTSQFPYERLSENEVDIPGMYRYVISFYTDRNRTDRVTAFSPEFRVEK